VSEQDQDLDVQKIVEEALTEPTQITEPELNEVEQQAYKEGWRAKDEFEGDPLKWVPADEFMRRKPLFQRIDDLKSENFHTRRELQEVKKTMDALASHRKKVRETEYKRALDELQTARREAMEDRDFKAVTDLEDKIDEVKEEKRDFERELQDQRQAAAAAPSPEYVAWIKENSWYETDSEMHTDADAFGVAFLKRNPNSTPSQVYDHVTDRIRRTYPDKFQKVVKPSPVDSGRNNALQATKPKDSFQLPPEAEDICRAFVKAGIMTRAEYIEDFKKAR
jgi:hypothetical protein